MLQVSDSLANPTTFADLIDRLGQRKRKVVLELSLAAQIELFDALFDYINVLFDVAFPPI